MVRTKSQDPGEITIWEIINRPVWWAPKVCDMILNSVWKGPRCITCLSEACLLQPVPTSNHTWNPKRTGRWVRQSCAHCVPKGLDLARAGVNFKVLPLNMRKALNNAVVTVLANSVSYKSAHEWSAKWMRFSNPSPGRGITALLGRTDYFCFIVCSCHRGPAIFLLLLWFMPITHISLWGGWHPWPSPGAFS